MNVKRIKELIEELKHEINSCQMDIAGGDEMNVLDAIDAVNEIDALLTPCDSKSNDQHVCNPNDMKTRCNNPMSQECCNKHKARFC